MPPPLLSTHTHKLTYPPRNTITTTNTGPPPPTYESEKEDAEFRAKLVGYTPDGAPILHFVDDPGVIRPERGSVLGRGDNGMVIVSFRREGVVQVTTTVGGGGAFLRPDSASVTEPQPTARRASMVRIASPPAVVVGGREGV